jgi:hypothetical protein
MVKEKLPISEKKLFSALRYRASLTPSPGLELKGQSFKQSSLKKFQHRNNCAGAKLQALKFSQ